MSNTLYFAPQRVPFIDQRTGLVAREWYLFLQALWTRSGGVSADSINDLSQMPLGADVDPAIVALLQELQQQPTRNFSETDQSALLGQLASLIDQVAEIQKTLQDMRQGLVVI